MALEAEFLDPIEDPEWAVFCDFDETWFAHSRTPGNVSDLARLEEFARDLARRRRVLFAWVSGCTLDLILEKCERNRLGLIPHYIAASHGGELVVSDGASLSPEKAWTERIESAPFGGIVAEVVAALKRQGIPLRPQAQESRSIRSYYLPKVASEGIPALEAAAAAAGLKVSVSPSNALAGDPADTYDIDFTPRNCSKADVVAYLLGKHGVDVPRSIAFGDNVGDLGMLNLVGAGYLLGNANPAASALFANRLELPYAGGILARLERQFRPHPAASTGAPS